MLRDPALIPLSHQHHNGLALCVLASRALARDSSPANVALVTERILASWEMEITNHFSLEEEVLFPEAKRALGPMPLIDELLGEHQAIRALIAGLREAATISLLHEFCELLRRHIRKEENELFPILQEKLPRETLYEVGLQLEERAVRICIAPF